MKKIVILGNSITAVKALEALRENGEDVEAVFISSENTFPYYRNLLFTLPTQKIAQNKIFYQPNTDYQDQKVTFIFDKKVSRVNFKRGRLTLEDKEQIDFDFLFLSDLVLPPYFGVKGANKTSLYNLKRLSDMTTLLKLLPLVETLVVESNNISGLLTALAFCEAKKEVILVTSGKNILSGLLPQADAEAIENLLKETTLRIMTESQITELLGDTDVKAIRLQNGKVYGCQAVLTDADLPDLRLFKESELHCSQRVSVNSSYQTNFENVFAMDAVCDTMRIADWDFAQNFSSIAEAQAKSIAAKITGKEFLSNLETLTWELPIKGELIKLSAQQSSCINLENILSYGH